MRRYNKIKEKAEEIHIFLAKPSDEILDAKWFTFEELPKIPIVPDFKKILFKIIED